MAIQFNKIKNKLGLDDTLPFGRHQGYTVEEILKDRPEYISWLMRNTGLKFYPSVHELLLLMKPKRVPQHTSFKPVYFYDGTAHGEQAHYELTIRDESYNIYSDQDDWFDDIPF